jgi:hypothetical protein
VALIFPFIGRYFSKNFLVDQPEFGGTFVPRFDGVGFLRHTAKDENPRRIYGFSKNNILVFVSVFLYDNL